jgi:hypothetical protein
MHFDGLFRRIGTIDPHPLAQAIGSFGEDAWQEWAHRQQTFAPHRDTQTIPLLYDDDMRHTEPTPWPRLALLEPVMEPVLEKIRKAQPADAGTGDGYFIRIILTRLSPSACISRHRDSGESLMRSHRYHVPVSTNRLVDFFIGGEPQHFAAGEIWEINNREYHAVRNLSAEPRVHLILDYVVPGEKIQDPDGLVIA